MRLHAIALILCTGLIASEPATENAPDAPRARALSPTISAALTEGLPKFNPPAKTAAAKSADSDDGVDEDLFADLPKPKNGIVRLPRVVVEGNRPPVFSEREIHTDKGLADLAVKRYFTSQTVLALNRFRLPLVGMGKEAYAMMLWQEDERLRLLEEYGDAADMTEAAGDEQRARELRDLLDETLSHTPLFLNPGRVPYRDARGQ